MELSPGLITTRLVTLVAELLLLGLALLMTLAEHRRGQKALFRPLLVALALTVVTVGVTGVLGTSIELQGFLLIPPVAISLALLGTLALLAQSHGYLKLAYDGIHPAVKVLHRALYGAIGLAAVLGIAFQFPSLYGIQEGAILARGLYAALNLALVFYAVTLLFPIGHLFRPWMLGSLTATGFWSVMVLLQSIRPAQAAAMMPATLIAEGVAVVGLVSVAYLQVTADLAAIATTLQSRTESLELASGALRQLHTATSSLVRAGSVKSQLRIVLDVLRLQLGYKRALIFLLNPQTRSWESYKHSGLTGQAIKERNLTAARKSFLTEAILTGQPLIYGKTSQAVDQDFFTVTGFSRQFALIPLLAPRVSYSPLDDPDKVATQRGSAWRGDPCWLADKVCAMGLGNFPQRLHTCVSCPAFEPIGALAIDLREVTIEEINLELLTTLAEMASLSIRDVSQVEELVSDIRFRTAAFDPLPLGIVLLAPDGRISALNRTVRRLAGHQAAGWLGSHIGEVPLTTKQAEIVAFIESVLRHPRADVQQFDVKVEGPERVAVCDLQIHPLVKNHVLTGILLTLTDKTETRQLQQTVWQQEQFATMGQLAMGIAHEVNNPLAGVSGLLQVLTKRLPPDAPEQAPIATALRDLDRASGTIRNLLQFARPKPSTLQPVDLNAVITETIGLHRFHPDAKKIDFTLDLDPQLPLALTDRESFAQVFTNLLVNAMQAIAGPGQITVGTYARGSDLVVTVHDTGPGIPPEILPRIFEPFFSTKKAGKGTGLGLSLCEMILTDVGAAIAVWSEPGATEFVLTLPQSGVRGRPRNGAQARGSAARPAAKPKAR